MRLTHAGEEKLDHKTVAFTGVGHGAVPEIVVDQYHCPGLADERHLAGRSIAGRGVVVLAAGHDAGWAQFDWCILRVVKGHCPTGAVVALGPGVLVQFLSGAIGRIKMAVAVGVQVVVCAEDALQGTVDGGLVQYALDSRDARQNIIAGIALGIKDFIDALAGIAVKLGR